MNGLNHAYISQSISLTGKQSANAPRVIDFLDANFPLSEGSHRDVTQYRVYFESLLAHLSSGRCVGLVNPRQLDDFEGDKESPTAILLSNSAQEIELEL